jgi:integrase
MKAQRKYEEIIDNTIPSILLREQGYKPTWLLCEYKNHQWIVANGAQRSITINFNVTIPGGRCLADYPNFYDTIKRIAYGIRTGPLAEIDSGLTQATVVANLITLVRWLIAHDITHFEHIDAFDISEYAKIATYGISAILNSESILQEYFESQMLLANFQDTDTAEERKAKAQSYFPYFADRRNVKLAREKILHSLGIGSSGRTASVIVAMLDEMERICGYHQHGLVKNRKFESRDEGDDKPVTHEHLRRFLMSFEYLWRHRRYLDDAIKSSPFPGSSSGVEAKRHGRAIGRTATVPFIQATHFIERSVRWVLDYSTMLLDLKDFVDDLDYLETDLDNSAFTAKIASITNWPGGSANPFPIRAFRSVESKYWDPVSFSESMRGGMALSQALIFLIVACAVVIATFTARRVSEILGLKVGCIWRDDASQPWMRCFILKTVQGESQIPVPEIVVKAVEILERLSKRARLATNASYIFQYTMLRSDVTYGLSLDGFPRFTLGYHLRRFGYFVDVPNLPDGSRWTFKAHQFRRFFAILYIWAYEKGDWGALQWLLRHFTSEMTERYVTENNIGEIISMVNRERTAQIITNAVLGNAPLGGLEGARVRSAAQKIHDDLAQRIEVYSEARYKRSIVRFIERTGLDLHGIPWGYCARRQRDDNAKCACSGTSIPHYSEASITTCTGCDFNMSTSAAAPFLETSNKFHRALSESPDTPPMLRNASAAIVKKQNDALAELRIVQT